MNKIFALLLATVFALTGVTALTSANTDSVEESTVEVETYIAAGTVLEVTDEYIVFNGVDGQIYQANITEETIQEYDLPAEVTVGDFVQVMYDGKMTRSIPAQITAQVIRSCVRVGQVGEVAEDYFMLQTEMEEIRVNCTAEQLEGIQQGMQVKVYFSGAMTMSLPAQIGAELIVAAE